MGDDLVANVFAGDPGATSQVTAGRVATLLGTTNVTLQSTQTLTIAAPVAVAPGGAASTLFLQSAQIGVAAPVTLNNASLVATTTANAPQSIALDAPVQSNASVSLTSPNIIINAQLSAATIAMTGSGAFRQSGQGAIVADSLAIRGADGATPVVSFSLVDNQVGKLDFDTNSLDLRIANAPGQPLIVQGTTASGLNVVATRTHIMQDTSAAGGPLTLEGGGSFTTAGSGNITLTRPDNEISGGIGFDASGDVAIFARGFLSASGRASGDARLQATGLLVVSSGGITARNIDISGVGVGKSPSAVLTPVGGRFIIRSSDFTRDGITQAMLGTGPTDINYVSLGGYSGAEPTTGNILYTNRTDTITPPNADNPPISKVYDGTASFTFAQTGAMAATLGFATSTYSILGTGNFTDSNAGVDKGHTVGPTTNTSAVIPALNGVTYLGLQFAGYTRTPGPHSPGSPGNRVSAILSAEEALFEELRFKQYVQGVSDAQEPFRRSLNEALASGFGKENIRKQLQRGFVFETGLAPPAVEVIESAGKPVPCSPGDGALLVCGL